MIDLQLHKRTNSADKDGGATKGYEYHIAFISLLLLFPAYLLFSTQNASQKRSFTELDVSRRLIPSEAVPSSLKECESPLHMAVPLLIKEQNFADLFLSTFPSKIEPSIANSNIHKKEKQPRVCIIVTTFNVVDYVRTTVDSVLNQSYQNVEVIIVDDNSNDGTTDLLLEKYATDPPGPTTSTPTVQVVRLTHNTNGGAGQPSNIGMDSCSEYTDYVMFADGDDYMELDAVETMLAHAEIFNSDIVMASFDLIWPLLNGVVKSMPAYDLKNWDMVPTDIPFNILTHPLVLRTSPVPWRKMYRREMLLKYDLQFPEGDYFYEDNGFHWTTLTHAARCSKIDRVLFHHRRSRMGQTSSNFEGPDSEFVDMSMDWVRHYTSVAKLSGYFSNMHGIGRRLFPETSAAEHQKLECISPVAPKEVASIYFKWLEATSWTGSKQITRQMQEKFSRRLHQVRHHWVKQEDIIVPDSYWLALKEPKKHRRASLPKEVDLSIIMPAFNVDEFIEDLLVSMYTQLVKPGFTFEVIAIDNGSTDKTARILSDFAKDHTHNFYFLSTSASNGAGKARNLALPLVEGRYTYFVDADDGYDFAELAKAVDHATKYKKDLMVMPYFVEYVDADKQTKKEGMMKSDERIWTAVRVQTLPTHISQKEAALGLINYPWKQLTSSKLLFDLDVFFGPTKVHNDVQFHWMSIAASKNIHFYHKEVCTHRKFDSSVHGQLTQVKDVARMSVFASLGMTQRALAKIGSFDGEEGEKIVFPQWRKFSINLLQWAEKRIPKESEQLYKEKKMHLLNVLNSNATKPSELRKWSYWGERFAPRAIARQQQS